MIKCLKRILKIYEKPPIESASPQVKQPPKYRSEFTITYGGIKFALSSVEPDETEELALSYWKDFVDWFENPSSDHFFTMPYGDRGNSATFAKANISMYTIELILC